MALEFNPYDEDDLEMCSNCFEEEEYDFGLCVACAEEALEEAYAILEAEISQK